MATVDLSKSSRREKSQPQTPQRSQGEDSLPFGGHAVAVIARAVGMNGSILM